MRMLLIKYDSEETTVLLRYASTSQTPGVAGTRLSRRSVTPGPGAGYNRSQVSQVNLNTPHSDLCFLSDDIMDFDL